MKKELLIAIGLVLLIASMPYASATTSVSGPSKVANESVFTVSVGTDLSLVEAAHVNITYPKDLTFDAVRADPGRRFDLVKDQTGGDATTGWVDIIFAKSDGCVGHPTFAELDFTATKKGNYTINVSSIINGAADSVDGLTVEVIALPGDVNGDGKVDYRDLVGVIDHWGESGTVYNVGGSGTVGYSDLVFIVNHWTG